MAAGYNSTVATHRITSVRFSRYKAFENFQLALQDFNVLVGPNNAGKSTIIGAFRILAEGLRKARARNAEPIDVRGFAGWGYRLNIADLPIAAENIFFDYDDSSPAQVNFRLSNGNHLKLYFPEQGACYLVPESAKRVPRTPSHFRTDFDIEIGFVPILGPVEQKERLYEKEAARLALLTSGASRNFRNIWHHYPEEFERFRELVKLTWPGMDIEPPESAGDTRHLVMFCPEERHPRELCWSGYGFQVWCQMLTFIVKAATASILVIDEPDIYLHSDLQRQLVSLLRELGPDILIATHSTEIIAECEPNSLLSVHKKKASAQRVKDASQLKRVFSALGSNLNPTLTQLAKTRRVVFVEGLDFQILSAFARTLGEQRVANRADFAVVQTEGFNPKRAVDLAAGIDATVGSRVLRAVVLDRSSSTAPRV
jgi:energy-coupling factor transporter ATP-binding protein EcfA2